MNPAGLVTQSSLYSFDETRDRLLGSIASHGLTLFSQIDHSAAATAIGLVLRPTMVVIFGNPTAGTLLMQSAQSIGIDLPLKALIWQDAAGATWLSHDDLGWVAERHGLNADGNATIAAMIPGLAVVVEQATGKAK